METMTLTEQQMADIKRLATAMREGAKLRPQAKHVLFRFWWIASGTKVMGSCALGAAWEGSHPDFNIEMWLEKVDRRNTKVIGMAEIENHFGGIHKMMCLDPFTNIHTAVVNVIIDMNDRRGYTREMIADWLETLVT